MGSQSLASRWLNILTMGDSAPEIWKAVAMADHFDKMQKLKDPVNGVPNFRRVPGYKVYCCGQPTAAGIEAVLEKVTGTAYPKDGKIIWFNLRQECSILVNGEPFCGRPANKIGEYAELGAVTAAMLEKDEPEFAKVCENRAKDADNKLKTIDVNKKEKEVEVKDVKTLASAMEAAKEKFPGLTYIRVPVCNSAAPNEVDFDTIFQALVGTSINTPIIVNDQVGLSRATTGCVIACLFKEFQINASFEGLVETVPGVNLDLLKMDRYTMDSKKDGLFRGEFEVVKQVVATLKDGAGAKNECDKVIDKNGTPKTGGTGIKQLRENIAESKLSYEIMDDAAQAFLKMKIMDNIHKYFYLIVFTAYMREAADLARESCPEEVKKELTLSGGRCAIPGNQLKLNKSFLQFCEDNANLRELVENGKGNLQWERDIPPAALANLENLAKTDFKANLGQIINDMPQGDHKKRAKYRFASKTLMRILPAELSKEVEGRIEQGGITLDLYDILGQCTWAQPK